MNKLKSWWYEIKSWFCYSCPGCGKPFTKEMKNKYKLGYNVICFYCDDYLRQY